MQVATELFYQQGFRATGINEVIEKSGVAKATFYSHFPSKDDLGVAYLKGVTESEDAYTEQAIREAKNPLDRFLSVLTALGPWLASTNFRGCPYMNMASEIPDPRHPLRKEGVQFYTRLRARVQQLAQELIESDPKKYGHLDAKALTEDYMVAFLGATALAELYEDVWPVEHALSTIRRLLAG